MAVDGCAHTFEEMVKEVLPAYMRQLRERMEHSIPMAEFTVPGDGPVTLARRYGMDGDFRGCYVLLDGDKPVYVGISRMVCNRLKTHVQGRRHHSATLAYTMTKVEQEFEGTRDSAMKDTDFMSAFGENKSYLAQLKVAFVQIDNAVERHLFELYCAMEFDTCDWNTFETH